MIIQITDLNSELPKNAIIIQYNDHYHANSGDTILFTNKKGELNKPTLFNKNHHKSMDDRGVISTVAIVGESEIKEFKNACKKYDEAAKKVIKSRVVITSGNYQLLKGWTQEDYDFLLEKRDKARSYFDKNNIRPKIAYEYIEEKY